MNNHSAKTTKCNIFLKQAELISLIWITEMFLDNVQLVQNSQQPSWKIFGIKNKTEKIFTHNVIV